MNRVHFRSDDHTWETPADLFNRLDDEFSFDLDVCALPPDPTGWLRLMTCGEPRACREIVSCSFSFRIEASDSSALARTCRCSKTSSFSAPRGTTAILSNSKHT